MGGHSNARLYGEGLPVVIMVYIIWNFSLTVSIKIRTLFYCSASLVQLTLSCLCPLFKAVLLININNIKISSEKIGDAENRAKGM